jgi:hypothetical protein
MGAPPHHDHLLDPKPEGDLCPLRHHSEPLGDGTASQASEVLAKQCNRSAPWPQRSRKNAYQGRFAGTVGTDDQDKFACP